MSKGLKRNASLILAHYRAVVDSESARGYARLSKDVRQYLIQCMDPALARVARLVCREWNTLVVTHVHPRVWCPYIWRLIDNPLDSIVWADVLDRSQKGQYIFPRTSIGDDSMLRIRTRLGVFDALFSSHYMQRYKLTVQQAFSIWVMFFIRNSDFQPLTADRFMTWMSETDSVMEGSTIIP
jgi:hypothetical protein